MKILITGATGFIGTNLINTLNESDHEIIGIARNLSNPELIISKNIKLVKHNLNNDNKELFEKIEFPDFLIHLAWEGIPDYEGYFNITKNLTRDIRFIGDLLERGLKKILVTGTCLEYGKKAKGELYESLQTNPDTPYGIAKDSLRKILENLVTLKNANLQWARLFYIYGEGQRKSSLFGQLDEAIKNNEVTFKMTDGTQLRDYLHIEEVVQRLNYLINNENINGIINICSNKPISLKDLVQKVVNEKKSTIELKFGNLKKRSYESESFWGNSHKLKIFKDIPKNIKN